MGRMYAAICRSSFWFAVIGIAGAMLVVVSARAYAHVLSRHALILIWVSTPA